MRYTCGHKARLKRERLEKWHKWFAWYPVNVGYEDCRWLEMVERKADYFLGIDAPRWKYRAIK